MAADVTARGPARAHTPCRATSAAARVSRAHVAAPRTASWPSKQGGALLQVTSALILVTRFIRETSSDSYGTEGIQAKHIPARRCRGVSMAGEAAPPPLAPAGVVELREDVPLKAGGGGGGAGGRAWCPAPPRLILASFGALSVAITLALLTQVYSGDYEVVPHGSVSSSAAACSGAGTQALKAGGRALDAAAAAALCLAVLAPHLTSLDASGALLYWEYRALRTQQPWLAEWGGAGAAGEAADGARPPRLLVALASLHAAHGALDWPRVLQPAIDLARDGFPVSASLAAALAGAGPGGVPRAGLSPAGAGPVVAGSTVTAPALAAYLESLQHNSSAELAAAWGGAPQLGPAATLQAGGARVWAGGARVPAALRALGQALDPPPASLDAAQARAEQALAQDAAGAAPADSSVDTGLAVIDQQDTYLALVMGLSVAFGSGSGGRDLPATALDLAPAIITDSTVCGTRYVVGAESGAALASVGALLAAGGGPGAVERPRAAPAAANLVQQAGDALLSHADSRAGGLASRF